MRAGNEEIADLLERVADLLEAQHADGYRVRAYRRASETCRTLAPPLWEVLEAGGLKALVALPTIGKSLATSIEEYLHTGRLRMLDRLEGSVSPEDLFTTLPGIGDELAHRMHDELGVETLEELEVAAHDGRLADVPGIGERRAHLVRDELAAVLSRSVRRRARRIRARERAEEEERPPVDAILEVDAEYREKAAADQLRKIAPRRFNPSGEAWLPVLHTAREDWHFTVLFSNTARAHSLGMTRDWVVVIHERDGHEGQCTVVTEHAGPRVGRRVVRGRESECPSPANAGPLRTGTQLNRSGKRRNPASCGRVSLPNARGGSNLVPHEASRYPRSAPARRLPGACRGGTEDLENSEDSENSEDVERARGAGGPRAGSGRGTGPV